MELAEAAAGKVIGCRVTQKGLHHVHSCKMNMGHQGLHHCRRCMWSWS